MAAALRERVMAKLTRKDATASPLEGHLRRATQTGGVDVPEDALKAIVQASNNEDDRREIMRHLREALSESAASQWRRVYAGIMVLEELLKSGSPDLVSEATCGVHFDLTQRLGFLEKYEYGYDNRVQSLIQRRATAARTIWLEKQLAVDEGSTKEAGKEDVASPSSSSSATPVPKAAAPAPSIMDLLDGGDLLDENDDNVATAAAAFLAPPAAAGAVKDLDLLGEEATTDGGESAKSSNRSSSPVGSASASSSTSSAAAAPSPPAGGDVVDLLFGESSAAPAAAEVAVAAAAAAAPAASKPPPPPPPAPAEVDWLKIAAEHGLLETSTSAGVNASVGVPQTQQTSNGAGCNLLDF